MVPELEPGLCSTEAVNSGLLAFCLGWTIRNAGVGGLFGAKRLWGMS